MSHCQWTDGLALCKLMHDGLILKYTSYGTIWSLPTKMYWYIVKYPFNSIWLWIFFHTILNELYSLSGCQLAADDLVPKISMRLWSNGQGTIITSVSIELKITFEMKLSVLSAILIKDKVIDWPPKAKLQKIEIGFSLIPPLQDGSRM